MGGLTRKARRLGRNEAPTSDRDASSWTAADLEHDAHAVERLDRALLGIRRAVTLSEITSMPLPELPDGLDLAKAMGCMAIADLMAEEPDRIVTVKDVAQSLALEHSTASRLLADTESEGLLERHTDPTDRRRTSVRLTEVGQRSVERIVATRTWALDALLADWSEADIDRFADYVERFTTTMRERLDSVIAEAVAHLIEADREG